MKNAKTTIAGITVGLATLLGALGVYLKTGTLDTQGILTAITGLGAAFGLWKAGDASQP